MFEDLDFVTKIDRYAGNLQLAGEVLLVAFEDSGGTDFRVGRLLEVIPFCVTSGLKNSKAGCPVIQIKILFPSMLKKHKQPHTFGVSPWKQWFQIMVA